MMSGRDDEKTKFLQFSKNPDIYETIQQTLAPEIYGHDIIKQAIACLLFGGIRKVHLCQTHVPSPIHAMQRMKDGTHRRGDVNVLLLGDPSTAKSQFLKFTSKVVRSSVYAPLSFLSVDSEISIGADRCVYLRKRIQCCRTDGCRHSGPLNTGILSGGWGNGIGR